MRSCSRLSSTPRRREFAMPVLRDVATSSTATAGREEDAAFFSRSTLRSTATAALAPRDMRVYVGDEDEGGDRDPDNLASSPMQETFYKSTKEAIDWRPSGDHSTGRAVVPSVFLENLFAPASVVEWKLDGDLAQLWAVVKASRVPEIEKTLTRSMQLDAG